MSHIEEI